jgi:hypothetical protein
MRSYLKQASPRSFGYSVGHFPLGIRGTGPSFGAPAFMSAPSDLGGGEGGALGSGGGVLGGVAGVFAGVVFPPRVPSPWATTCAVKYHAIGNTTKITATTIVTLAPVIIFPLPQTYHQS